MKLQINSRNYNLRGYLKEEIEERLEKLEKFFADDASVIVTISGEKSDLKKADITVRVKNNVLRSEAGDKDVRVAIDNAMDKLEKQLIKHKEKLKKRNNDSIRYDNIASSTENGDIRQIVKNKTFVLTPMSTDEACFQLELLDHEFFVFLNEVNNKTSVVYKRNDGDYGLIEVEM